MKYLTTTLLALCILSFANGQTMVAFVDSIRGQYRIPELAFDVVSSDSVLELQSSGVQRINTNFTAQPNDRFHIGSNTKAITAFVAALLVKRGDIKWDTKFLEVFPELKQKSRKEYYNITLKDLLTFRGKLPAYTYTFAKPTPSQIKGNNAEQRYALARYFLSQPPMQSEDGYTPSNADYILAGLMMEKKSGKPFKTLVTDFGNTQGIRFGFDYPNLYDTLQPWGHDTELKPIPPFDNYKFNWLLSAGNININLPDYTRFIQLQLKGLRGETDLLSQQTFDTLLYGLPIFSFGWFTRTDTVTRHTIAYSEGNAGAFITRVEICKDKDRAYIIFTNAATEATEEGTKVLINILETKYGR